MAFNSARLTWLVRRLSRMYWQEVPYRALAVVRGFAQSKGRFSATVVPTEAADARWGASWCAVPDERGDARLIEAAARALMDGKLDVFGQSVPMRNGIPDWNADPVTGTSIGATFGLSIDFRHIGKGVDIKFLWEVNRHLWWVPLAQHYALSGDPRCLDRIGQLLSSWLDACPYAQGANWSSPVEHGIRLINWSLVWQLIGGSDSPLFKGDDGRKLLDRWLESIYQHMRFASDNYSFYSSADNHLIGEAAGVYVASQVWDRWSQSRRMRRDAKAILERETLLQFSHDGVNLEQASCYHKFSLQFLLASGLCARANGDDFSPQFWSRIEAATSFMASMMDSRGHVPSIGDSDDGEVWCLGHGSEFNSYRSIVAIGAALFQRRDLQAKVESTGAGADSQVAWLRSLVPPPADMIAMRSLPSRFDAGGYAILGDALHTADEFRVTFDCGPLGYNRIAGHGHADALSVLVSWSGVPLFVDPGTYCYNAAPEYRHFFRGTHAHNTLVVDGRDQSDYGASFLWLRDVESSVTDELAAARQSVHASHDGYTRLADPVVHHRRVTLGEGSEPLVIEDWIECAQPHDVEMFWHAALGAALTPLGTASWRLVAQGREIGLTLEGHELTTEVIEGRESPPQGWVSSRFYERSAAPVIAARTRLSPGQVLRTVIRRESGRPIDKGVPT
ncbi:MAG: alginate lyase family protein [Burkholderiales bacterium]